METDTLIRITTHGLLLCLYISLPVVAAAAVTGLLISFVQAITSLQDQSISFGVKLAVVTVVILITAPWAASSVLRFANEIVSTAIPS